LAVAPPNWPLRAASGRFELALVDEVSVDSADTLRCAVSIDPSVKQSLLCRYVAGRGGIGAGSAAPPGRRELPLPNLGDDDALVRVAACGLCGTDHEQFTGALADVVVDVTAYRAALDLLASGRYPFASLPRRSVGIHGVLTP
jgi:hypothetical protein